MTLVLENIRYMRNCGYSRGLPWASSSSWRIYGWGWAGASNDSGVVDDGNFWRFGWLRLWKRSR